MKTLGISVPWTYIDSHTEFIYIRMKEFHKNWTLHDHTIFFIPARSVIEFLALLLRKKQRFAGIGRIEAILSDTMARKVLHAEV